MCCFSWSIWRKHWWSTVAPKDYELNKTENSDISGLSQGIEIGTKVEVTFDKDMNILAMVDPGK